MKDKMVAAKADFRELLKVNFKVKHLGIQNVNADAMFQS